jgi:hypothetical protein
MTPGTTNTPGTPNYGNGSLGSTTNGVNSNNGIGTTPGTSMTMPGVSTTPGVNGLSPNPGYSTNLNPNNGTPGMGSNSLPGNNYNSTTSSTYNTPTAPMYQDSMNGMDRFGGTMDNSNPDLNLTASFIGAGGGAYNFNIWTALREMGGRQFAEWQDDFQFAVLDSYLLAKKNGIDLPATSMYWGPLLGQKVVDSGQDGNKNFYLGVMLYRTVSHGIHWQVLRDIDSMSGERSDYDFHRITNQAMVDLAHQLRLMDVKTGDVTDNDAMNNNPVNNTMPATQNQ